MAYRNAQTTVEPSRRSDASPREGAAAGPPLGRRIFSLRNIASVFLTLLVLYLVYRQVFSLDWQEVWTTVQEASPGLFALALVIFYCSFPLRALRWKALLANLGYGRADGRPMPSALGLTRIMYVAWFVNCVTVARLGDAYRGYLLKKAAGVSFAVTLGTVLAERRGGSAPTAPPPFPPASSTASSTRFIASRCSSPSPRSAGSWKGRPSTQWRRLWVLRSRQRAPWWSRSPPRSC